MMPVFQLGGQNLFNQQALSDDMGKALVLLSGGQDSTTCLFWAKERYDEVHALTINYGQRHTAEIDAAQRIGVLAEVDSHEVIGVPHVLTGSSPLITDTELEQYDNWETLPGGLEKTFVPGRNALFMVLATNRAYNLDVTDIVLGICQEDYGGYPDCREVYRKVMEAALSLAMDKDFTFHAPLMFLSKAQSVELALEIPGAWQALAWSHTSYDGAFPPTGHDHATLLRAKGFEQAGEPDPLILRAYTNGLMDLPATENYNKVRSEGIDLEYLLQISLAQLAEA